MSERLNNQPHYEEHEINGRKVRVVRPEQPQTDPVTEIVAQVTPPASVESAATDETQATRTEEIIQDELNSKEKLRAVFEEMYGDVPAKLTEEIDVLKTELQWLQLQQNTEAEKANILKESSNRIASFESEEEAAEREYQERLAAIRARKKEAEAKAKAELEAKERLAEELARYLTPSNDQEPSQKASRLQQQAAFDEGETMFFDTPLVPKVVRLENPAPQAPPAAAEGIVDAVAAATASDQSNESANTPAVNEPFMQQPGVFAVSDFNLQDGLTLAKKSRGEKVKDVANVAARAAARAAGKAAVKAAKGTAEVVRKTNETGYRPSRRIIKLGVITVIAASLIGGGAKLIGEHNKNTAIAQEQEAANTELAAQIFASCDETKSIEAFQTPWLTNTYDAVAGITFYAQNGAKDAEGRVHAIGPNKDYSNSIMTITNGEIDTIMCDNDSDPAITIDGTNVTVNADKLTAVSGVVDNNKGAAKKFIAPYLAEATPNADGSLTQADIDEIKVNSQNIKLLQNTLAQSIETITTVLNGDTSPLKDTVKAKVLEQAQQQVTERLANLNKDTEYTVKVSGKNPAYNAVEFASPADTKKTQVKPQDTQVKITK